MIGKFPYYLRGFHPCMMFYIKGYLSILDPDYYIMDDYGNAVKTEPCNYGYGWITSMQVY